ncbi:hypothetical protein [Halobacillus trueperi]|uniref:Uncharacterized protein n=1 Tax=Halobacillus trueperi TaxID=156205 RepID=A0A3E0J4Q8_9BACI|nr:hypothetical protein [Halobacillus trueperi]REJ07978.1 hypothetical protein DYE48_15180 [Halobacillus trueperi]
MKKNLALVSLLLIVAAIVALLVYTWLLSMVLGPLSFLFLGSLLLASFITALKSERGFLKIIALIISSVGMVFFVCIVMYIVLMIFSGNFGT